MASDAHLFGGPLDGETHAIAGDSFVALDQTPMHANVPQSMRRHGLYRRRFDGTDCFDWDGWR